MHIFSMFNFILFILSCTYHNIILLLLYYYFYIFYFISIIKRNSSHHFFLINYFYSSLGNFHLKMIKLYKINFKNI